MKIYIAGPIPKGDNTRKTWIDWKVKYKETLNTIDNIKIFDADTFRDEDKPIELVGYICKIISEVDLVIINCENKLGAGTSQEMLIAKYFNKPVISIIPKNSHHRKSDIIFNSSKIPDWIHPFILTFSDKIFENINESIEWIEKYSKNDSCIKIKDLSIIDATIKAYENYKKL